MNLCRMSVVYAVLEPSTKHAILAFESSETQIKVMYISPVG